jgi:lipoprotein-releasing system permease protein
LEEHEDKAELRKKGLIDLAIAAGLLALCLLAYMGASESVAGYSILAGGGVAALTFAVRAAIRLAGKQPPWWLVRSMYAQAYIEQRDEKLRDRVAGFGGATPVPVEELGQDEIEDAARAQHRLHLRDLQRRRGRVEQVLGALLLVAGTLFGVATEWILGFFGIVIVGALLATGLALVVMGFVHILATKAITEEPATQVVLAQHRKRIVRGWVEIVLGVVGVIGGVAWVLSMWKDPGNKLRDYFVALSPFVIGYLAGVIGTLRLMNAHAGLIKPHSAVHKRNDISIGFGFRTFVAWRYLMARHHKVSRVVLAVFFVALFAAVTSLLLWRTMLRDPFLFEDPKNYNILARVVLISMIAGFALLYFTIIIGMLRFVFSFFTTVPIVGVWIGTAALICVLSVMSGFETDLRQKILGSNAHIQITAESGEMTNWEEIKARIDKVPGVKASTPYAVSEVVIAANNNGMNVIIKGIDPATVGHVTKLIDSIKDDKLKSMKELEPIIEDTRDLTVPQEKPSDTKGKVVDPAPDDMPAPGDPIDFSQPTEGAAVDPDEPPDIDEPPPADPKADPKPPVPAGDTDKMRVDAFGGDAKDYLVESKPLLDPAPSDLITSDEEPVEYAGPDGATEAIDVDDLAIGQPSLSRRTQSLHGILVGQELVKQTHLYVGQEVRVVSPLSDPSNPDATGTPIPFNRDYRVAGVFFTGMYEYDLKYVYVTLDSLSEFLDRGGAIDGIEVRIGSADDTDEYVAKLQSILGKQYRVQDWKELNRSLFSALKLEKIAMFLVLGIVILVASFSIVGNLIMVVVEKAREIALLKTLGAADMNVMLVFAIQGLLIGVIGTALGVVTGLLACWLGKDLGIPLNPDVYYIDKMPVHVESSSVFITAAAGVVISMLATFYPAVVAARVRPAAGMRH